MDSSAPIRPEPWLAHAGWMRVLAEHLLADPADVDDVVQDACVAAWRREVQGGEQRAEQVPGARPLEPWLARVVRNLAAKRKRSAARRGAHEEARPPLVSVPTPAETAQRLDLQRVLIEEVRALEEPLRTTLLLRFFEERTSAAIAAAEHIPEGTVRWRVKRGLAELRERLDRRLGGREAWAAIVLPLGAAPVLPLPAGASPLDLVPESTLVATGVQGVLLMSALVKSIAAVGVVTIVAAVWWTAHDAGPRRVPAREVTPGGTSTVLAAVPLADAGAPLAAGARVAAPEPVVKVEANAAPSAPVAAPVPPGVPPARVDVRFVDADGGPWADVHFECRDIGDPLATTSAADGRAELELRWPKPGELMQVQATLVARRAGSATLTLHATLLPGTVTHLGDVVLRPGARVLGHVVDLQGSLDLGQAQVGLGAEELPTDDPGRRARHGSEAFDTVQSTTAERDGTFVLAGVAPGRWRLWAHVAGARFAWTEPFTVEEGRDVVGLELALTALLAEDRIAGVVLDPHGEPLPHAALTFAYSAGHERGDIAHKADEHGRFDYLIQIPADYGVLARDPEGRFDAALASGVQPGTLDLELRLRPRSFLELRLVSADESAVERAAFQVTIETDGARLAEEPAVTRVDGLYRLPTPPWRFDLDVMAPGFRPRSLAGLDPTTLERPFEIVLEPALVLVGRVVCEGRPVSGARVQLRKCLQDERLIWNGFECLVEPRVLAEGDCDADGRFELPCEVDSEVVVRALAPGLAAGETERLDPARAPGELRIELTRGGVLEGRVLVDEGQPAEGTIVGINRGDVAPRTMRAGPEGRFRFEGLTPGGWQVTLRKEDLEPGGVTIVQFDDTSALRELEWSCEVRAGQTTQYDLDLRSK